MTEPKGQGDRADDKDDIKTRLSRSGAVASLRLEQEIVAAFQARRPWSVEHGPYFKDSRTSKPREFDVRASCHFTQNETNITMRLKVLVEAKTMKDYHLVFADAPSQEPLREQCAWIGHGKDRLRATLRNSGLDEEISARLMNYFDGQAYPNDTYVIADAMARPPHDGVVLTAAFRETNVGGDKEYGASVLWKAIQSLNDARDGEIEREYEVFLSNTALVMTWARHDQCEEILQNEIARSVRFATLIHPVIIVDARLWLSTGEDLTEVPKVRFVLRAPNERDRWFDIVNRAAFPTWLDELETHYRALLESQADREVRERGQWMSDLVMGLMDPNLEVEVQVRDRRRPSKTKHIHFRPRRRSSRPPKKVN